MLPVSRTLLPLNTQGGKNRMPIIGFGTYTIVDKNKIYDVLDVALSAGYRLIDTAALYKNEEHIRDALEVLLPIHNLNREDLFITSKLAPKDHGDEEHVKAAVSKSLINLGTNYLDLYLIHWPGVSRFDAMNQENSKLRNSTWKTLMKLHDNGKGPLKNIGVSNYTENHLKEMLSDPTNIVPAVNQIEFHPYFQQSLKFHQICRNANIVLQAYFSLGGSVGKSKLLYDNVINRIADKYSIQPAQVLLRWAIQRNIAIIPKSITPERIKTNFDVDKELSEEDMNDINNVNHVDRFSWNPEVVA